MGWGDEILVTGEARALYEQTRRHVVVTDRHNKPRWHELWTNVGWISKERRADTIDMQNGPGCRPYIDYERMAREFHAIYPNRTFSTKRRDARLPYRFNDHKAKRGHLPLIEDRTCLGYSVIEPHYSLKNCNREWGFDNWQAVVEARRERQWVQINPKGARILRGVHHYPANSFVAALRILAHADLYVGPEGGLYHAAVALGIPSVAIFGGFVSPANQGYDLPNVVNLWADIEGTPCGQRVPCDHCKAAMSMISPGDVRDGIVHVLKGASAP